MRIIKSVILLIGIMPVLTLFQNCGSFETTEGKNLSSQCTEKLRSKALSDPFWKKEACEEARNYKCHLSRFSPYVSDGKDQEQECVEFKGKEVCFSLSVLNFSTANLQAREPAQYFEEGGSYNRREYTCTHRGLMLGDVPIIQTESDDLADAVQQARTLCLEKSQ